MMPMKARHVHMSQVVDSIPPRNLSGMISLPNTTSSTQSISKPPPTTLANETKMNIGDGETVAGLILIVLSVIAVCAALIFILYRQKQSESDAESDAKEDSSHTPSKDTSGSVSDSERDPELGKHTVAPPEALPHSKALHHAAPFQKVKTWQSDDPALTPAFVRAISEDSLCETDSIHTDSIYTDDDGICEKYLHSSPKEESATATDETTNGRSCNFDHSWYREANAACEISEVERNFLEQISGYVDNAADGRTSPEAIDKQKEQLEKDIHGSVKKIFSSCHKMFDHREMQRTEIEPSDPHTDEEENGKDSNNTLATGLFSTEAEKESSTTEEKAHSGPVVGVAVMNRKSKGHDEEEKLKSPNKNFLSRLSSISEDESWAEFVTFITKAEDPEVVTPPANEINYQISVGDGLRANSDKDKATLSSVAEEYPSKEDGPTKSDAVTCATATSSDNTTTVLVNEREELQPKILDKDIANSTTPTIATDSVDEDTTQIKSLPSKAGKLANTVAMPSDGVHAVHCADMQGEHPLDSSIEPAGNDDASHPRCDNIMVAIMSTKSFQPTSPPDHDVKAIASIQRAQNNVASVLDRELAEFNDLL
ncbi:hypothetical protein ACHAWF_010092 [Thalassiosira exigua]